MAMPGKPDEDIGLHQIQSLWREIAPQFFEFGEARLDLRAHSVTVERPHRAKDERIERGETADEPRFPDGLPRFRVEVERRQHRQHSDEERGQIPRGDAVQEPTLALQLGDVGLDLRMQRGIAAKPVAAGAPAFANEEQRTRADPRRLPSSRGRPA